MKQTDFILTIFFFVASSIVYGQTGMIEGQVYDRRENKGLGFVNVWLVNTEFGTTTDFDGNFIIDGIPTGTFDLKVSFIGYGDTTLTDIKILDDTIKTIKLELPPPCKYDKNRKNKVCPICSKKDKVIPIVYGLPIGELDRKNLYYAGCEITFCDPNWYCKRDKYKF